MASWATQDIRVMRQSSDRYRFANSWLKDCGYPSPTASLDHWACRGAVVQPTIFSAPVILVERQGYCGKIWNSTALMNVSMKCFGGLCSPVLHSASYIEILMSARKSESWLPKACNSSRIAFRDVTHKAFSFRIKMYIPNVFRKIGTW